MIVSILTFLSGVFCAIQMLPDYGEAKDRIEQQQLQWRFDGDITHSNAKSHNKTVVCALDSWAYWRPEERFQLSDIDPSLCSQLVYRLAEINNTTFDIKIKDFELAERQDWFRQITALSKNYPQLKVLLSVGGWEEGSWRFSKIAENGLKRLTFTESVMQLLSKYGFHGLDVAWEYPGEENRGGSLEDKQNLPFLLKNLRKELGTNYLLTLTTSGNTDVANGAYDFEAINAFVDQYNIRAFDFAGAWNKKAYHHAPLRDLENPNVEKIVNYYLENGVPADKLVLGIPFYGRTFILNSDSQASYKQALHGLGSSASGGFGGAWVENTELLGYHEICHIINTNKEWRTYSDNFCYVPFAENGTHWVSFDNPESIISKVQHVHKKRLKGVLAWTIDTDDFKGTACSDGGNDKYPLLRTINYELSQFTDDVDDIDNSSTEQVTSTVKPSSPNLAESGSDHVYSMGTYITLQFYFLIYFYLKSTYNR